MGSNASYAYANEKPVNEVKVDSFLMDKFEVTNYQFSQFVKETGYITTAEKMIDWDELKKQLDDLNKEKFNLRFQASNGQLSNTGRVKEVRRGIAKIKTLLNKVNEKE